MNKATITRTYKKDVTLGEMSLSNSKGETLSLKTIELPWKENKSSISCIPKGTYSVIFTLSPRLKKKTYRVVNVKGRDGILFHPANFSNQLKGCIAPCLNHADINNDGVIDGTSSRVATESLEGFFNKESFELTIQ
jgi:hypothetical protein